MAGNDDLIASLHEMAEMLGQTFVVDPVKLARFERYQASRATALADQDATIERLTKERDQARATEQKLHRDMQQREGKLVGAHVKKEATFWLMLPFDIDGLSAADKRRREYIERLEAAEARATTAERERDEARAEVERLRGTRETEETGWLVELNGERPRWWCVIRGKEPDWSTDASQALRFARKVDAEDYINEAGWTEAFASEHIWTDTRAALQQSEVKP